MIVDAPPTLLASETAEMAVHMGTLLMVARAGDNELGDLTQSIKRTAARGRAFQGVVLNALDARQRRYAQLRLPLWRLPGARARIPSADAAAGRNGHPRERPH